MSMVFEIFFLFLFGSCHAGHALSLPHLNLFYCDCGANEDRYHRQVIMF